jgi:hypothetical protein
VLNGFSAHYGVALPAVDRTKPADKQAALLLRAITPAFANSSRSNGSLVEQSGGLAASVAALFVGAPVSLAIGGAALVGNLHGSLFPPTDFQSAFTEQTGTVDLVLCTSGNKPDAGVRLEFIWMVRLPDTDVPTVSLAAGRRICRSAGNRRSMCTVRRWRN